MTQRDTDTTENTAFAEHTYALVVTFLTICILNYFIKCLTTCCLLDVKYCIAVFWLM